MLDELRYSSPVCIVLDVQNEGVLCGSISTLEEHYTETFDDLKEFEW